MNVLDVINMSMYIDQNWKNASLLNTGIAWDSDKNIKFRNPPGESLEKAFESYTKPKAWKKHVWQLDPGNPDNNGL